MLIREETASEWPGTQLLDSTARIDHYLLDGRSRELLIEVNGLYSWLAPELPEDLALYQDGRCWMASIAHERQAWLHVGVVRPEFLSELQTILTGRIRGRGRSTRLRRR